MRLINSDEQLRMLIPHVLTTVEGETTFLEKLTPFLDAAEEWAKQNFTSEEVFNSIVDQNEDSQDRKLLCRLVTNHAYLSAIPSLDIILTPNGFGIVANQNIAPASKERVERLIDSIEAERDQAAEQLLCLLATMASWHVTQQGKYFAATLFPFMGMCHRLAIREHIWSNFQQLHERLIKIENVLAETYFSEAQMNVFRQHVMNQMQDCSAIEEHVIHSLRSYELLLVSDMQVHPQSFFDLVNIIREHEEIFPAWHSSSVAELYTPKIFENKKSSSGFWF